MGIRGALALHPGTGWGTAPRRGVGVGAPRVLTPFVRAGGAGARHGHPVLVEGREAGTVTSGTFSPTLRKNVGMAYLPIAQSAPGTRFEVSIRGRGEPAVAVRKPFYKRAKA